MNTVSVIGLGKIGLPLAVLIAEAGHTTYGVDVRRELIDEIRFGGNIYPHEPGLMARQTEVVESGRLIPTLELEAAVQNSSVVVIVVPLIIKANREPDFAQLDQVTRKVADVARPGSLIVYETTLPVGTTRGRFLPILSPDAQRAVEAHLVAHSPERVSSGSVFTDLMRYPKLVGGVNDMSGAAAVAFYESVISFDARSDLPVPNGVWDLGSAEAAEFAKLAETTYRDLNIAYANELALYAESINLNVRDIIAASNSQPYSHIHTPGLVGGHCIPVYPWFLLRTASDMRLPRMAREINLAMPSRLIHRLQEAVGPLSGLRVVVLGLAYRGSVRELAFSGALSLIELLLEAGAHPLLHDPMWSPTDLIANGFEPYEYGMDCDCVIIQTDHEDYRHLNPGMFPRLRVILDIRGVTRREHWDGVTHLILGA